MPLLDRPVCYGASSWTMCKQAELQLLSNQRRMLRYIVSERWTGRGEEQEESEGDQADFEEQYWQYLQRTAREIDELLERTGIENWVKQQRRRISVCADADEELSFLIASTDQTLFIGMKHIRKAQRLMK